jgi:MFS family permease
MSLASGIITPVLPIFLREFDAGYGLVGLVLSGQAIGMLLSDLPSGMVLRRLGQRRAMILGFFMITLSMVALFWSRSGIEVLTYRLVTGIGFSIMGVARHAYITENAEIGVRGRAVALFGGINRIGRFSGPAIGGLVASATSLRVPFLVAGGLMGLVLTIVIGSIPRTEETTSWQKIPLGEYIRELRQTAKDYRGTLGTVGLGQLFAQMVRTGRNVFVPLYGADVLGLNIAQIGWISSMASAVDMMLFYPVGIIMDRFGRKYAIVPSFLIQGIGLGLIPFAGSLTGLAVVAGLVGFGNGLGSGTMMTLGADLAPKNRRGEFLGLWRLIGDLGFTLGPLLAGSVASVLALSDASVVVGGSGVIASLIFYFLVPETGKRD